MAIVKNWYGYIYQSFNRMISKFCIVKIQSGFCVCLIDTKLIALSCCNHYHKFSHVPGNPKVYTVFHLATYSLLMFGISFSDTC